MNTNIKTDRLDEAVWNRHRTTIESLYWETSLDKIDAHMKKHYGFVASKSQYERHFRKWELRKNLTAAEWAATIRYLTKDLIELEQVEVLFKGREIPQSRVLQEIARRSSLANTLHHGSHKLPKDITVRPRARAPAIDPANGLQIIPNPSASSYSSSMQVETDFGLTMITSPSVYGRSLNGPTLVAEYSLPFLWTRSINFDSISQSLFSSQQLVKWKKPSTMQLDAIFHSRYRPLVNITHGSHDTTLPLYAIASLANNLSCFCPSNSDDAYALLKALPLRDVSQSLKALPAPILDTLKERVFATAVRVGDIDLVSTMLELNMDAHEQIMMDWPSESKPTYPLQFAVAAGHFEVAKTLILHLCREATHVQLDELLEHVIDGNNPKMYFRHGQTETTELMCIALRAGATPRRDCLRNGYIRVSMSCLRQLIEATTAGIVAWLEVGLLEHCCAEWHHYRVETQTTCAKDFLLLMLHDERNRLPTKDPSLKTAILGALNTALRPHNENVVGMILEVFSLLGYRLDDGYTHVSDINAPDFTEISILEAFHDANWNRSASLLIAQKSAEKPMATPFGGHSVRRPWPGIYDAIGKNDLSLAFHKFTLILPEYMHDGYGERLIELAITHRDFTKAIIIIENFETNSPGAGAILLTILLRDGHITAVSTLLMRHPVWNSVLGAASGLHDAGPLESLLFHGSAVPFCGIHREEQSIARQCELQFRFRILAYHVMATNDYKLCSWLFQLGMDPDEFYIDHEDGLNIFKAPGLHCCLSGGICTPRFYGDHTLPSLLAVAAGKNHIGWMKFLVTEGVPVVDSMALLWAIRSRSTVDTLNFLLDAAKTRKSPLEQSRYGVAALRQAIRYRDITRIEVLCGGVNADAIEPFIEESEEGKPAISPLGEAIIAKDSEIVLVLLKHGASSNAYVSFDGLMMLKHVKSHIHRVTPLLTAIDVQSLPLVKVLVEHKAELQYTRNMGITRTPLQRAAETGCFDIVEYLVGQGAIIDTIPVYSGGTALQLAAMSGFCGIAAFLLEHGADPNYPPAKGNGRTAFEAAAEWGHVDTMSLLMQWRVNLDAQFGEPPESQYERARRFAEKNGFMASKRFVEHLYGQRTRDESWHAGLALDSM